MSVSVCFPYRSDGGHRDRLAGWVMRRWQALFPEYELSLGGCDEGPFNRSQAINNAFAQSSGDIIIVADLDTIFQARDVQDAVVHVMTDPYSWGFAFTDYIKLTAECTERVLDLPVADEFHVKTVDAYEASNSTMSGLVVISRPGFELVGGFDAGFVGWGYEDMAFTMAADRKLSPHFRVPGGYLLHLEHDEPPKVESTQRNGEYFEEKYLGLFKPEPKLLPNGRVGEPYPEHQMTVLHRTPPLIWSADGLPIGLEIDPEGEIAGTPRRAEQVTSVVSVVDADNVTVTRTYSNFEIIGPKYRPGQREVGLYCDWDESFDMLMTRLHWATPGLAQDNVYKSFHFAKPEDPHRYALVFNATKRLLLEASRTYVLIFEPPEILGENHPWLTDNHPQAGANISMFGGGSVHRQALGLHLPQATLSPPDCLPSRKPFRCSMICSDSNFTPYHKKRREVLAALRNTDLDIHFYGRGMGEDPHDARVKGGIHTLTKDHALRPYTFTIDFENTHRDVLTDKFIDPILSGSIPITNSTGAAKVFPPNSFEYVDFDWPVEKIVAAIGAIITQSPDAILRYDRPVARSKRLVSTGPVNICEWLYRKIERL